MAARQRVALQPAFVLHHRPYRDTSLLLEVFSRDHGRVGLVARGARAVKSRQRPLLQPFQPVLLSWSARGELGTLTGVEAAQGFGLVAGKRLFSGFYMNELILRMLHRDDPHPELYTAYAEALRRLARGEDDEHVLRAFEVHLLRAVGYGLTLDHDIGSGRPVEAGRRYRYVLERGPVAVDAGETQGLIVDGGTLLALARGAALDAAGLRQAKRLMRAALALYLGDRPLRTRELFRALYGRNGSEEPEPAARVSGA